MEKYYNKISLWARIINKLFVFTNMKKNSNTVEAAKKFVNKLSTRKTIYNLPSKLGLNKIDFQDMDVYCYNGNIDDNKKKILYIHGGSYVEQANYFQIKFAMKLAKKNNLTLIFPVYPLAPVGDYKLMYKLMDKLYKKIINKSNDILFLGDSAGGGFILSYAMYLRDTLSVQPKHIIMLSPWIDISMTNTDIYKDAKYDNMCGVDGTRYEGELWANGLNTKDPLVSPIYGNFNSLGQMTIIVGGREILTSECLRLHKLLNDQKIEHNFIMYKGQGHIFPMYPIRESKMVLNDITEIISRR